MTQTPRIGDVIDYLRAHGWAVTGEWRNASVWSWREFDVLVPPTDATADATVRLRELARCVADAEDRSPEAVRRDMATPAVDLISYRVRDAAGPVTLPAGVRAVSAVRDLIAVCAHEVLGEPGHAPHDETSDVVRALLERSLLSVSDEVFGLDVSLPIEEGDPDPLGRRTALRVLRNSTAVLHAVRSSDADAFEQVFRQGISESVCDALADLAGGDRTSQFELGFRWSRRAPLVNEAVEFPRGAGQRIRTTSRPAEQVAGTARGVVEGPVISLSDDEAGVRRRIKVRGVLEVDGVATGGQRQVTVWLGDARDYEAALAAHRDGRIVRAEGAVAGSHRTREITAADEGFTVTDHPPM